MAHIFEGHQIRARLDKDNKVWLVAKDIAEALDYTWSGSRIDHVPDAWKTMTSVVTVKGSKATLRSGKVPTYDLTGLVPQ